ncbi:sensor domain-containing diguanylate cyclase [Gracilibacillus oryzae]|uniref:Sensor domain-containing diguanylate cyclase n=1 Tax=Gracilibacillus oryzae TaxID=1672701 RepID=A0A7C8KQ85_9BACI|nr:sensor domain-containing diguanylate cyclase [Gracilibacillus oryzae]KAB8127460.1 sensor domain-containing diguanylate cyclase [Gracilibacillus oryzae]
MRRLGFLTTVTVIFLVLLTIFYQSIMNTFFSLIEFMLIIGLTIISLWLGRKYDMQFNAISQLTEVKDHLHSQYGQLHVRIEEYEQFFNSFDGVTLFMFDLTHKHTKFSKGVEVLFGMTQNQFNGNGELWKDFIHPADRNKVNKAEQLLFSGKEVQIDFRIIHPTKGEKWITKLSKPITDQYGTIIRINGQFKDITKQKELENELRHMAYFDDLTDLPNRKMLDRHIKKALARSKRQCHNLALMFVDLDDFKQVNDTLGHDAGDQLLREVVDRIGKCIREEDVIARIGGDEFILVFEETDQQEIEKIAKRIIQSSTQSYTLDGNKVNISVSAGISMYPDNGMDKVTLIQNADKAMYDAKNKGKNNYSFFSDKLKEVKISEEGIFASWFNKLQGSSLFHTKR